MASIIKWTRIPFNNITGAPQRVACKIYGYGFNVEWKVNFTPEFSYRTDSCDVILKLTLQMKNVVCFNGKLCRDQLYTVRVPYLGAPIFVLKPFILGRNMDVRIIPSSWLYNNTFYYTRD